MSDSQWNMVLAGLLLRASCCNSNGMLMKAYISMDDSDTTAAAYVTVHDKSPVFI